MEADGELEFGYKMFGGINIVKKGRGRRIKQRKRLNSSKNLRKS